MRGGACGAVRCRAAWYEAQTRGRTAYIIPAFEPVRQGVVGRAVAMQAANGERRRARAAACRPMHVCMSTDRPADMCC